MGSTQKKTELLKDLERAVFEYDAIKAELLTRQIVNQKIDIHSAFDCLTKAISIIGDRFAIGELFLPELVGAGFVVDKAMKILQDEIKRTGKQENYKGVIVIGTVFGDIHSIGKNMVAAFCRASGFKVIDLGENISAEKFIKAVENHTPNILAMSSLLTTTMAEQQKIIKGLSNKGIRKNIKIMVGGGPVTKEFSIRIGADGYSPTAPGAAKLALELLYGKEVTRK
jgi:5-methyltetrahydrofolate--homocysteine methyltransferase